MAGRTGSDSTRRACRRGPIALGHRVGRSRTSRGPRGGQPADDVFRCFAGMRGAHISAKVPGWPSMIGSGKGVEFLAIDQLRTGEEGRDRAHRPQPVGDGPLDRLDPFAGVELELHFRQLLLSRQQQPTHECRDRNAAQRHAEAKGEPPPARAMCRRIQGRRNRGVGIQAVRGPYQIPV